jgi:hypothetical protein
MKTTKILVIGGLVVAIGWVVARVIIKREAAPEIARPVERGAAPEARSKPTPPAVTLTLPPDSAPTEPSGIVSESAPPAQTAKKDVPPKVAPQSAQTKKPKEPRLDPLAREAMALVGVDRDAEAYWLDAINDPILSDNEREDLIEDLNENGFSGDGGRRPTMEDLPLIERRLLIVEQLWPYAMDQNNWNAFQEVYKDLSNMYVRLAER